MYACSEISDMLEFVAFTPYAVEVESAVSVVLIVPIDESFNAITVALFPVDVAVRLPPVILFTDDEFSNFNAIAFAED